MNLFHLNRSNLTSFSFSLRSVSVTVEARTEALVDALTEVKYFLYL